MGFDFVQFPPMSLRRSCKRSSPVLSLRTVKTSVKADVRSTADELLSAADDADELLAAVDELRDAADELLGAADELEDAADDLITTVLVSLR